VSEETVLRLCILCMQSTLDSLGEMPGKGRLPRNALGEKATRWDISSVMQCAMHTSYCQCAKKAMNIFQLSVEIHPREKAARSRWRIVKIKHYEVYATNFKNKLTFYKFALCFEPFEFLSSYYVAGFKSIISLPTWLMRNNESTHQTIFS
jgi:hypothetical protein